MHIQLYYIGDRILYHGLVGEIISIGIYQRETPDEHYEYTVELTDGTEHSRIRAEQLKPYQITIL